MLGEAPRHKGAEGPSGEEDAEGGRWLSLAEALGWGSLCTPRPAGEREGDGSEMSARKGCARHRDLRLPREEAHAITSPSQSGRPALQCLSCAPIQCASTCCTLPHGGALHPPTPVQGSGSEKTSWVMKQVPVAGADT